MNLLKRILNNDTIGFKILETQVLRYYNQKNGRLYPHTSKHMLDYKKYPHDY